MVIWVDENDNELGFVEKMEAHHKGMLHRAISVIILNSKGEMLLQQRAGGKYHSAGLWTNTCCSHPAPGESARDAAHRRLFEEMGITANLRFIRKFHYKTGFDNGLTENEIDYVFVGSSDDIPEVHPGEVESYRYVNLDSLKTDLDKNPQHYTVWFRMIMQNPEILDYFETITLKKWE